MDEYFVRVYTMNDGQRNEPNAIYQTYEQAKSALGDFNGLSEVSFVQIEKRFSVIPIW